MLKLMKYLKGSVKSIFLIILLLVLQAFCDLSLPSYTSNIVNIGIQQGGVDSHVPEVIREEQMEKITIFIEEKEQKLVEDSFELLEDPAAGVKDADVVVTAVWNNAANEAEAERRMREFLGYQLTGSLLENAKPGCMVLHCLPAHRGEEITDGVFEAHAKEIFDEAENRLHAQKAVMVKLMR